MKYETLEGEYPDALSLLLERGGQLFPQRRKYSANVVLRGRLCTTFWPKNSPARRQVIALAGEFGIPPTHQTSGRIARYFINDILALQHKETYFCKEMLNLARGGSHWHYLYCETGDLGYCFELDVRAAYFNSLLLGKTLLFDKWRGYVDDRGAKESLLHCRDFFANYKWFRLVLLGVLASHQKIFWVRAKEGGRCGLIQQKIASHVAFGAAFNAAHGAILRVYNLMKKLHEIAGDYCVRVHTDSLLLKEEIPVAILDRITGCAARAGFELALKHEGRACFFDQNTGWIGKHIVGEPRHLVYCLEHSNIRIRDESPCFDWQNKWESFRTVSIIPSDLVP